MVVVDIYRRWNLHKSELIRKKHHSIILQRHFNKYGIEDLVFTVIEECSNENLINKEQEYLDEFNPYFNIRTKANSNLGIKRTKETIEKIRIANTGKIISIETKKKMAKRMIGNKYTKGITPVNARKVKCIVSGKIFEKIEDAANYVGLKRTTLNAQLKGVNKNKTTLIYL